MAVRSVPAGAGGLNPPSSWAPIDLSPYLEGEGPDDKPTLLIRNDDDDTALLYAGKLHALIGETESAKTWVAIAVCAQEMEEGRTVMFIDFEDSPRGITQRFAAVTGTDVISSRLVYVRPEEKLDLPALEEGLTREPSLVVIDGVTEAMVRQGLKLTDNTDVASFYDVLPRRIAATGAAVLMLDHVTKSHEDRGRYALGGQHKLAGIDGAAYNLEVKKPFGRGGQGLVVMKCVKDRPGWVRGLPDQGRTEVEITSSSPDSGHVFGHVFFNFRPTETASEESTKVFRPTELMERLSRQLERSPEPLSTRELMETPGKRQWLQRALKQLKIEGYVEVLPGAGGACLHVIKKPFRAGDSPAPE